MRETENERDTERERDRMGDRARDRLYIYFEYRHDVPHVFVCACVHMYVCVGGYREGGCT